MNELDTFKYSDDDFDLEIDFNFDDGDDGIKGKKKTTRGQKRTQQARRRSATRAWRAEEMPF